MQNGEVSEFEILTRIVTILAKIPKSHRHSVVCLLAALWCVLSQNVVQDRSKKFQKACQWILWLLKIIPDTFNVAKWWKAVKLVKFEILARIVTILAEISKSQCRSVVCLWALSPSVVCLWVKMWCKTVPKSLPIHSVSLEEHSRYLTCRQMIKNDEGSEVWDFSQNCSNFG